jgi:hypothetical protein
MANIWSDETPEQRESRLAMCACLNADVAFRGVRDGVRQSRHPRATFTCWNTGTLFRAPS